MNNFTKKDLQNGDMIVLRDGAKGVWVCNDKEVIVMNDGTYMHQSMVKDDLTSINPKFDIMNVYRGVRCFNECKYRDNLVYDRAKIEESKSEEVTPDKYIHVAVTDRYDNRFERFINKVGYDNILQIMPTGWLAPSGELFKCNYYEHNATAEEICKKFNIEYNNLSYFGKDDALFALGWCKLAISSLGDKQYWVHWQRPLTSYQRYFLNDYFSNEEELLFPMDITSIAKYYHEDEFFNME